MTFKKTTHKPMSREARDLKAKLRLAKGKKKQEEREARMRPDEYRPGMGKEFYTTRLWRDLRYDVLRENAAKQPDGRPHCELCAAGAKAGRPLHVDHIRPRSFFPWLELDKSNLQVLCDDCNIGKGAKV
jgi:5-methylcytosine-specific restriction endonuclease McrA